MTTAKINVDGASVSLHGLARIRLELDEITRRLDVAPEPRRVSTLSLQDLRVLARQMTGFRARLTEAGLSSDEATMLAAAAGLELLPR
jgi:hypothetical protein